MLTSLAAVVWKKRRPVLSALGCFTVFMLLYSDLPRTFTVAGGTSHLNVDSMEKKASRIKTPYQVKKCNNCFERNFTYIHNPVHVCQERHTESDLHVVFMVLSKPDDFLARKSIRNSWLRWTLNNTASEARHVFLTGDPDDLEVQALIDKEQRLYGDIVQQDFIDKYNTLTLKVIMGLDWATQHCTRAKYVMKVDSDVWVNARRVVRFLHKRKRHDAVIGNCILRQHRPKRKGGWKWRVPWDQYNHTTYPAYCQGPSYLVPTEVAKAIVHVSPDIPFLKLEDVYIGICVRATGYQINHKRFYKSGIKLHKHKNIDDVYCVTMYNLMTTHRSAPRTMEKVWEKCYSTVEIKPIL